MHGIKWAVRKPDGSVEISDECPRMSAEEIEEMRNKLSPYTLSIIEAMHREYEKHILLPDGNQTVSISDHGAIRSKDTDNLRWDLIPHTFMKLFVNTRICYDSHQKDKNIYISECLYNIYEFLSGSNAIDLYTCCLPLLRYNAYDDYMLTSQFSLYHALKPLASTLKEGHDKYAAWNWIKGFPIEEVLNHACDHLLKILSDVDTDEDDAGHALCNLCFAIHFNETRPDLKGGLLGAGYTITPELERRMQEKFAASSAGMA